MKQPRVHGTLPDVRAFVLDEHPTRGRSRSRPRARHEVRKVLRRRLLRRSSHPPERASAVRREAFEKRARFTHPRASTDDAYVGTARRRRLEFVFVRGVVVVLLLPAERARVVFPRVPRELRRGGPARQHPPPERFVPPAHHANVDAAVGERPAKEPRDARRPHPAAPAVHVHGGRRASSLAVAAIAVADLLSLLHQRARRRDDVLQLRSRRFHAEDHRDASSLLRERDPDLRSLVVREQRHRRRARDVPARVLPGRSHVEDDVSATRGADDVVHGRLRALDRPPHARGERLHGRFVKRDIGTRDLEKQRLEVGDGRRLVVGHRGRATGARERTRASRGAVSRARTRRRARGRTAARSAAGAPLFPQHPPAARALEVRSRPEIRS
eukprot:659-Pelagococcus_subviridis.AAC.6